MVAFFARFEKNFLLLITCVHIRTHTEKNPTFANFAGKDSITQVICGSTNGGILYLIQRQASRLSARSASNYAICELTLRDIQRGGVVASSSVVEERGKWKAQIGYGGRSFL